MSGLKDRLRRLTKSTDAAAGQDGDGLAEKTGSVSAEGGASGMAPAEQRSSGPLTESLGAGWEALDAVLETNEWGSFIKRRRVYQPDYRHGHYFLGELEECAGELAAFHEGEYVRNEELLFFDTETTGLGIGAGNVPFMVGVGFWDASRFVVEQLFIRNPAEELAMLAYFHKLLHRFSRLVSYNGRAFDWPILKNRFVLNRIKDDLPEPLHLDFLYPSRSLWRNTLPSCRLGKVEEERLGFRRIDDVPGSLAPTLYFQYLAEKDPALIRPVFIHNEYDVLSLAGLAVHFARTLSGERDFEEMGAEERFRTGLWLGKLGKRRLSLAVLEPLAGSVIPGSRAYWLPLAAHYKQSGEQEKAAALWLELIRRREGNGLAVPLEPYVELAIHYEHRVKDCATALLFAEEARVWARKRESLLRPSITRTSRNAQPSRTNNLLTELDKRIERLKRKLGRQGQGRQRPAPSRLQTEPCADTESLTLF